MGGLMITGSGLALLSLKDCKTLIQQYNQRQHHGHKQKQRQHDDDGPFPSAQGYQGAAAAFAADRGIAFSAADQLLIDKDIDGSQQNQYQTDGKADALLALNRRIQRSGYCVISHLQSQKTGHTKRTHGLGEGQDNAAQDGWQHQRKRDAPQNQAFAGADNFTHLLQLAVDAAQGR